MRRPTTNRISSGTRIKCLCAMCENYGFPTCLGWVSMKVTHVRHILQSVNTSGSQDETNKCVAEGMQGPPRGFIRNHGWILPPRFGTYIASATMHSCIKINSIIALSAFRPELPSTTTDDACWRLTVLATGVVMALDLHLSSTFRALTGFT